MSRALKLKALRRDTRGAYAVEFALLTMPFLSLLIGGFDLTYQLYATSVVQGTVYAAARKASLEGADLSTIETYVREQLKGIATGSDLVIKAKNYRDFTGIGKPEKITTDTAPVGSFNLGDCYIDENKSKSYDTREGVDGLGGAEYVVNYSVEVRFDRLTPMAEYLGMGDEAKITRSTVLRTEPYAGVIEPPTVCTMAG